MIDQQVRNRLESYLKDMIYACAEEMSAGVPTCDEGIDLLDDHPNITEPEHLIALNVAIDAIIEAGITALENHQWDPVPTTPTRRTQ